MQTLQTNIAIRAGCALLKTKQAFKNIFFNGFITMVYTI